MSIKVRDGHPTIDSVLKDLLIRASEDLEPGVCEFEVSGGLCQLKCLKEPCDKEWWSCQLRAKALLKFESDLNERVSSNR